MRAVLPSLLVATLLVSVLAVARAADPPAVPGPAVAAPTSAAPALPAPPPRIAIRLSYILGPGTQRCPPEQVLHDEVARRMGYDPFTTNAPDRVVVKLIILPGRSTSEIKFEDNTGGHPWEGDTLRVDETDCMVLLAGIAIYIATEFLPYTLPAPAAPPPPPVPPSPPPPSNAPPVEAPLSPPSQPRQPAQAPLASAPSAQTPPPAPRRPASRRPSFEIGAGVLFELGIAPSVPSFGGVIHFGVKLPSLPISFAVEGRGGLPSSYAVEAFPGAVVKTTLAGGSFVPCVYPRADVLLCGVATYAYLHGEGVGITNPIAAGVHYFGAGPRAAWEPFVKDHIGVRVHAEVRATLVQAEAYIAGQSVWRSFPVSADVGATVFGLF